MARATMTPVTLWLRWAILNGSPRAALAVQTRRGDPLARLLVGPQRGGDPQGLTEQIRARGRLVQTPLVWVSADHELCRTILRDNRFKVTTTENMNLPAPLPWLIRRTDPQLPHPAEPPSMLQVDPPDHTRYRHPVAHAFTPRAVDRLRTRIIEVTNTLLDRLESLTHADLITDYAAPLPAEIIADILAIPDEQRSGMLSRGKTARPSSTSGCPGRLFGAACRHCATADARSASASMSYGLILATTYSATSSTTAASPTTNSPPQQHFWLERDSKPPST